jgi:hypothetical protein
MKLHGKEVRRVGTRYFAIPHLENRAGRIAMLSEIPSNLWQRVMRSPVGSQVICNQKRADGRRDARMARITRASAPRFAAR